MNRFAKTNRAMHTLAIFGLMMLLFFCFQAQVRAESCADYLNASRWLGSSGVMEGHATNIALNPPYIYATTYGSEFYIADISDPSSIILHETDEVLGAYMWNDGPRVFTMAYISSLSTWEYRLMCYDLSDWQSPVLQDSLTVQHPISEVSPHGDHLLVASPGQGLLIVDATDPFDIEVANTWVPAGGSHGTAVISVKVLEEVAYVGTTRGMFIMDLAALPDIEIVGQVPGPCEEILIDGRNLVTYAAHQAKYYRIDDPRHPVFVRNLDELDFSWCDPWEMRQRFPVSLGSGLLASGPQITALDSFASTPAAQWTTTSLNPDHMWDLAWMGDKLIQTVEDRLEVLHFEYDNVVEALDTAPFGSIVETATGCGDKAFLVTNDMGLRILDLNSLTLETFDNPDDDNELLMDLNIQGDLLTCVGSSHLWFYDVSVPEEPILLSSYDGLAPFTNRIAVQDNEAWAARIIHETQYLFPIDLTDPTQPVHGNAYPLDFWVHNMELDNGALFVAGSDGFLHVFSVDSGAPIQLARMEFDEGIGCGAFHDGLAVIQSSDGIALVDVSEPSNPGLLSAIPMSLCSKTTIQDGTLYASCYGGMLLFDITDPASPVAMGTFWAPNWGHVVLPDGRFMLHGIQSDAFILAPAYCDAPETDGRPSREPAVPLLVDPNPFNPTTTIRFDLPRSGKCELVIHDLRGQVVRRLYQGFGSAGTMEFEWQGRDTEGRSVASGVYLAVLNHAEGTTVQKMALVR